MPVLNPASCPLGQTYFYSPGPPGPINAFYTPAGGSSPSFIDGSNFYAVDSVAFGPTALLAILETPAVAAFNVLFTYWQETFTAGVVNGTKLNRVVQIGSGVNGVCSAQIETIITGTSTLTIYFRVYNGAGTLIHSTTMATVTPNPYNHIETGTIRVIRTDAATSTFAFYLNEVLLVTHDAGILVGNQLIAHHVKFENPVIVTNYWRAQWKFKDPYYIGQGLPGTCLGTLSTANFYPYFIPGM